MRKRGLSVFVFAATLRSEHEVAIRAKIKKDFGEKALTAYSETMVGPGFRIPLAYQAEILSFRRKKGTRRRFTPILAPASSVVK